MRYVSFRRPLLVILALWCVDPPAGSAVITYQGGACAYVRIFTPGETARESFNCPNQLPASYSRSPSVEGFGMKAQAQQTTTGAFLPNSMSLDSTGSAILTVGSVAQGSGGLVLSQLGITFQNDATRPFTLTASLSGPNVSGSFIQLTNSTTASLVFSCDTNGPCVRAGALAAGSHSLFINAENRRNAGGPDVFGALSSYEFHLTVGAPTAPSPTPTPAAPVTNWINPAGGDFGEASNWDPPEVPVVNGERADNASFTLTDTYAVNVAGAHANRIIIRDSSIDLVGGTAEATSTSLAEPSLVVGQNGKLHLVSGTLTSVHSVLGDISGALAEVDLISGTPTWNNTGRLTIGDAGPGRLTVVTGQVASAEAHIGGGTLGPGEAIVGGPGAWTTGNLGLGFGGGPGTLEIKDGGVVTSDGAVIGVAVSDGNRVDVRGATAGGDPSQWNVAGMLEVGGAGLGVLAIRDGAHVGSASLKIGDLGDVTIDRDTVGADTATLDVSGTVTIAGGHDTNGSVRGLVVGGGAALTAGEIVVDDGVLVGNGDILTGTLTIRKEGYALLNLGAVGVAQADVTVDGVLDFRSDSVGDLQGGLIIGSGAGVAGAVNFVKAGSDPVAATIANGIFLGNGSLSITGGATVTVGGTVDIGTSAVAGDAAQVFVDDPNGNGPSTLTVTQGKIDVGVLGPGQLVVSEGSSVTTPALALGGAPGARGDVFIQNATLTTTGGVTISDQAGATLNVTGGPNGTGLVVGGAITIGTPFAGGAIFLSDAGRVSAANGITVNASSFIEGTGVVAANVTVNAGGEVKAGVAVVPPVPAVAPKSARQKTQTERALASRAAHADTPRSRTLATLPNAVVTITGDLTMSPGSTLRVEIDGSADGLPALLVQGGATLAGTLEIAFVDGFVPRAGDELRLFAVLGLASGTFTNTVVTGLPPGWKGELSGTGAALALTVFGDYLCYQTKLASGAKFPKGLHGGLATTPGPLDFGVTKPALLCNPSGPSTGSQQDDDTRLRGYLVTDPSADPLAIAARTLRVTNGLHPVGELVVDTSATTLVLAPAAECRDLPPGTCPTDLAAPVGGDAFVCALAKRSKSAAAFPKTLTASAVDAFGEPRTYKLAKPTRVCAPTTGDLGHALACYAAKPLGKVCALAAPVNAAGACKGELDCGGTKKVTHFCAKQAKHAKVESLVLATDLARDHADTVKPLELCVPSALTAP